MADTSSGLCPIPHSQPPPTITSRIGPESEKTDANKSFASAVRRCPSTKPRFPPIQVEPKRYGSKDGKPSVVFSEEEVEAGAACYRFSLVAKFTYGRPSTSTIIQAFKDNWPMSGRATVAEVYDSRHLLIILDSEEDMVLALTSTFRKVKDSLFRLFRYSSSYDPRTESPVIPKWIRLPNVHPDIFHKSHIAAIVGSFGRFLDIDDQTRCCKTLKFARACVEVDITSAIPGEIWVGLTAGRGYWQRIIVEGKVDYCSSCKLHGHTIASCKKAKSNMVNMLTDSKSQASGRAGSKSDDGPKADIEVNIRGRSRSRRRSKSKKRKPIFFGPHLPGKSRGEDEMAAKPVSKPAEDQSIIKSFRNIIQRKSTVARSAYRCLPHIREGSAVGQVGGQGNDLGSNQFALLAEKSEEGDI